MGTSTRYIKYASLDAAFEGIRQLHELYQREKTGHGFHIQQCPDGRYLLTINIGV